MVLSSGEVLCSVCCGFIKNFFLFINGLHSVVSKEKDLFCRIWGYNSGLFGLNVVTYGIKLLPLLIDSFCLCILDFFKALIFVILSSMRDGGYFC